MKLVICNHGSVKISQGRLISDGPVICKKKDNKWKIRRPNNQYIDANGNIFGGGACINRVFVSRGIAMSFQSISNATVTGNVNMVGSDNSDLRQIKKEEGKILEVLLPEKIKKICLEHHAKLSIKDTSMLDDEIKIEVSHHGKVFFSPNLSHYAMKIVSAHHGNVEGNDIKVDVGIVNAKHHGKINGIHIKNQGKVSAKYHGQVFVKVNKGAKIESSSELFGKILVKKI
jgi:uncharacterized protein YuzE